jgi:peroxiredoxin Q/BCP
MAPDFSAQATDDVVISLKDYRGKTVILFFYPKDNTAGCTAEVREFAQLCPQIAAAGAVVLGVSRDSVASHEKFKEKLELPYPLLSDAGEELCRLYDVLKLKNRYGKKVIGVERSTFIIDGAGRLVKEFRKVKALGHAAVVLAALQV